MMANSCKPIFISNAEIMIHFKNESSNKGGSPPAWLSANSYHCKAFGTGALAYLYGHHREKQTMPFAFSSCMLYQNMAWILSHLLENAFKEFQA